MTKRGNVVNYLYGVVVTRNVKEGKRVRFTFHFPSGVVFHSNKSSYTRKHLRKIAEPGYQLDESLRESYSEAPDQPRELAAAAEFDFDLFA